MHTWARGRKFLLRRNKNYPNVLITVASFSFLSHFLPFLLLHVLQASCLYLFMLNEYLRVDKARLYLLRKLIFSLYLVVFPREVE